MGQEGASKVSKKVYDLGQAVVESVSPEVRPLSLTALERHVLCVCIRCSAARDVCLWDCNVTIDCKAV